ncbi:MAG: BamA/TamA family outer membrane protein [Eudoraea sp.]|nr:BamA/TamA family outer membrane protein [Eudoraea sp.]
MRSLLGFGKGSANVCLFLLSILITSCSTLKRVEEDELLLTKNYLYTDDQRVLDEDIQSLIVQKPNSTVLGYPFRLNLYNLAKPNPDSSYQAWLSKKDKREERLARLLSKKQVGRLGESFLVKGYSEWLKNIGEAPVVIDTLLTIKSLERLSAYYDTKGYFNNTTEFDIEPSARKQRAAIRYQINLGKPYIVDTLTQKISSSSIDSLYQVNKDLSFIKNNKQFDLVDFNNERERLTGLFRNSGVYNFQESSITFEILRDTIAQADDQRMDVQLNIDDLRRRNDTVVTTSPYNVYTFDKINIYADYNFQDVGSELESIEHNNYTIYYRNKLRYNPEALTDAIFMEKDSVYRDIDRLRTYRQITNLNTFKYPNIEFIEDSTQTRLSSNIYLAPRPKYSLGLDFDITHSNIQQLGIGFSTSLITRNMFGGAETLAISAGGTFGLLRDETSSENFFSEIRGDVNLTIPRMWFPLFNAKRIVPAYMLPQTRITVGTSFQKNIGLDKQTFNTVLGYTWNPSIELKNTFELLNIQYVRNVNPDRFFNVYGSTYNRLDDIADDFDSFNDGVNYPELAPFFETTTTNPNPQLIIPEGTTGFTEAILSGTIVPSSSDIYRDVSRIEERRDRLTENNLIFASNYTWTKNSRSNLNDNSFYQLRLRLESAGNLLSGLANFINFEENDNSNLLVFGVPFSQYVKTEIDYIKYWDLSGSNVMAFRSFFGIAVPYGNSNSVPFVRSYFAGGSNDNRGWFPYSLGPGSTQAINDFNEANFKIALNLEYRFPLVGDVKGALFADAGNIWNVWDNVDDPKAVFRGFDSLDELALGTGFGLRYDFSYFVFRLDTGFKTYNPANEPSKRWFSEYNFANAVFQIGINYPF